MTDRSVISVHGPIAPPPQGYPPGRAARRALDVFAEKGFAAARMEDIAARAGAAKGTLYLYFPSKEAVFEALVRTLIVPNLERAEAALAEHAGRSAPLLRQAVPARWPRSCATAGSPCCRAC